MLFNWRTWIIIAFLIFNNIIIFLSINFNTVSNALLFHLTKYYPSSFLPVPPDILSSGTSDGEVSVLEGENATLSCKASGRPSPRVFWRREKSDFILVRGVHDPLTQGKVLHQGPEIVTFDLRNRCLFITARYMKHVPGMKYLSMRKTTTRINYSRPYIYVI